MEAAVLGTPSIRLNDFVGISKVFDDLDKKYELSFGLKTCDSEKFLALVLDLVNTPRLKEHWQEKRTRMLVDKTDVTQLFIEIIEEEVWKNEKVVEPLG